MGRTLGYAELDRLSAAFAAWLQAQGRKKGDRIAMLMPKLLQYPVVFFGAMRAGLIIVNYNRLYTADELQHHLADSGASIIVILENFCCTLQKVFERTNLRHVIVTSVGDLLGFPKGAIVDFVVRTVRKQVPPWDVPGALKLRNVLE